jgi:hypothetical protein
MIIFEGMLEFINVHDDNFEFKIYSPKMTKCIFKPHLLDKVIEGLGKKVKVRGKFLENKIFEVDDLDEN